MCDQGRDRRAHLHVGRGGPAGELGLKAPQTFNPQITTNGPNSLTTLVPKRGSPQPILGNGSNFKLSFLGKFAKVAGAVKGVVDVALAGALVLDCLAGVIH